KDAGHSAANRNAEAYAVKQSKAESGKPYVGASIGLCDAPIRFQVALVELDLLDKSGNPSVGSTVIIAFGVCTTLLVSVHLLAVMMSTCILPYMEACPDPYRDHEPADSLMTQMRWYIEMSWFFSTVLGLLLFLLVLLLTYLQTKDPSMFPKMKAIVERHLEILEDRYTSGEVKNGPLAEELLKSLSG
uniref:Uncharacterized protein n=1 Tax=Romanomermis culicivorax TaxID=13658 RepID=A0A915JB52_ROMCU